VKRETAWRVFAGEYNDSTVEIKGEGDMAPSYIVTPLGAKINRMFIIGVLTDVENISEGGDLVRAHISDPTGVFTLYSGSYQKDITDALSNIEVPAFVAVVGKVRTYTPEEGTLFVSVRPEKIMEVSADTRDKWILETCQNTRDRIGAVLEAMKMEGTNVYEIHKLGYSKDLSEGIVSAIKNYGKNIDINKYITLIKESIEYLRPGNKKLPDLKVEKKQKKEGKIEDQIEPKINEIEEEKPMVEEKTETETKKEETEEKDNDSEEIEKKVYETIKKIEGEDGAAWDTITEKCGKIGLDKDLIEEALNSLMDKGLIYEPILGTIKTT